MRAPSTSIFWGTYLRLADLRHRLANIIVAVPRSTLSRRVVEHFEPDRHRTKPGSETGSLQLTPSPAHPDRCTGGLPSRASKSKPTSAKTTLDKPFHIIARYALGSSASSISRRGWRRAALGLARPIFDGRGDGPCEASMGSMTGSTASCSQCAEADDQRGHIGSRTPHEVHPRRRGRPSYRRERQKGRQWRHLTRRGGTAWTS